MAGNAHRARHILYDSPSEIKDPGSGGTITIDRYDGVCGVVTAAAEARTLRRPTKVGIVGTVVLKTDGGDLTLTVTGGYNEDGDTSITFDTAGNMCVFRSIKVGSTYRWELIFQSGTSATTETLDVESLSIGGTAVTATAAELNNAADNSARLQSLTGAGAVTVDGTIGVASIDSGGAYAITLAAPSAAMRGRTLVIEYGQGTTDAVTLALTNVQGGSAATTATFNADNETLILIGGESKWNVVKEIGVTLA